MLTKNNFILLLCFFSFSPLFARDVVEDYDGRPQDVLHVQQALQNLLAHFDETQIRNFAEKFGVNEREIRSQVKALKHSIEDESKLRAFINNVCRKARFDGQFHAQFEEDLKLLIADQKKPLDEVLSWVVPRAFTSMCPLPSNAESIKKIFYSIAMVFALSYNCTTVYDQLSNPLIDAAFNIGLAVFIADLGNAVIYRFSNDSSNVRDAAALIIATHILCHCVNLLAKMSKYCCHDRS